MTTSIFGKDRLNTTEFLELIPHLSLEDLLLIEFYRDVWHSMISVETNKRLACSLCNLNQFTMKSIYVHIEDKNHKNNLELVKELYHPEYTISKKNLETRFSNDESDCNGKETERNKSNIYENASKKIIKCVELCKLVASNGKLPNHTVKLEETIKSDDEPSSKKNKTNTFGESLISNNISLSNYQLNRIIIPSLYKQGKNVQQDRNEPLFAVKTFSSKPFEKIVGLIGVEYVIKIIKTQSGRPPRYECCLCELNLNGPAMQNHIVGYNHRLNYCEKHFSSALRQFKKHIHTSIPEHEFYKVMIPILEKLAIAIEEHHGRKLPYECSDRTYLTKRAEIISKACANRHASEESGPSFLNIFSTNEICSLIESRNNSTPHSALHNAQHISLDESNFIHHQNSNGQKFFPDGINTHTYTSNSYYTIQQRMNHPIPLDNETHKRMVDSFLQQNTRRSKSFEHIINDEIVISPSTHKNCFNVKQTAARYNCDIRMSNNPMSSSNQSTKEWNLEDLNIQYEVYREDPEKHPMYSKEWKLFWRRRKDELIAKGLDYHTYNYQVEWVKFFKNRLEELYKEAVELESMNGYGRHRKNYNRAKQIVDRLSNSPKSIDESPKVVAVLRYMTALEDQLGSLGPKIIELLSKSLQIEKTRPEDVNSIMLTNENCTLLQTCKEKFRGLVIAGLLEKTKERALKKSIHEIEDLLARAERANENKRKCNRSIFTSNTPFASKTITGKRAQTKSANNEGLISLLLAHTNKKELASRLASILMEQGRTDINPDQLQQLIAVYTVLEKKKREAVSSSEAANSVDTTRTLLPSVGQKSGFLCSTETKTTDTQASLDSLSNNCKNVYPNIILHRTHDSVTNDTIGFNTNLSSLLSNTSNMDPKNSLNNIAIPNITGTAHLNNIHNNNNMLQMRYTNFGINNHHRLNVNNHFQAPRHRQTDTLRNGPYFQNDTFGRTGEQKQPNA